MKSQLSRIPSGPLFYTREVVLYVSWALVIGFFIGKLV